jgi:hypothetical protein
VAVDPKGGENAGGVCAVDVQGVTEWFLTISIILPEKSVGEHLNVAVTSSQSPVDAFCFIATADQYSTSEAPRTVVPLLICTFPSVLDRRITRDIGRRELYEPFRLLRTSFVVIVDSCVKIIINFRQKLDNRKVVVQNGMNLNDKNASSKNFHQYLLRLGIKSAFRECVLSKFLKSGRRQQTVESALKIHVHEVISVHELFGKNGQDVLVKGWFLEGSI